MTYKDTEKNDEDVAERRFTFKVNNDSDVSRVRNEVKKLVSRFGLEDRINDVTIALTELCTNVLKYTEGGKVTVQLATNSIHSTGRASDHRGLEITVNDSGPGIYDVEQAFEDGFSSSESRGDGLGKVNESADEIDVSSGPEGTKFTFRVWDRSGGQTKQSNSSPLSFGFATRRHPAMEQNGDAFLHKSWNNRTLIGVIDGVGHGQHAHVASLKAREYIEGHYDLPLESVLAGTNRACRGTRGVVAGLLRFYWNEKRVKVEFAGVGNIECIVVTSEGRKNLISKRGLLGKYSPSPIVISQEWTGETRRTVFLHSDGISSHWSPKEFEETLSRSASEIANQFLLEFGRINDDATIAVAKYGPDDN